MRYPLSVLLLYLFACSSDQDTPAPQDALLCTWQVMAATGTTVFTGVDIQKYTCEWVD